MREYGKQLNYDSNNNKLIATMSNLPFKNEAANVVARKYNEITLKVTNNNETTPTTTSNIKETPWFYKSQYLKNILDEIDKTTIGSYNFTRYNQEQKVGGKHLSGLKYNFSARKVEGTPVITDWQEGETSRIIPVYMATTHTGKDSDYITLGILQNITVNKPQPPVVPPAPQPQPSDTAANVLASGTATKDGKQIQWQVINNDKNTNTEQIRAYAQYLSYNPDTNTLTMTDAAAFTENSKAISARKFSNITLKIKKDGKTTEENIKETPWFFKDQNSKNMWDSINQTPISTQTFEKYNLEQKIGGAGLEGLTYDFLNKNFDGAPTIAWNGDEKIREIPVYIATIHKGKDGSDYMTVGELKKFKAYKNRNDIFEGEPRTNPLTKQQYKFSDLGDDNVSKTVTAMYADGPIYLKPGETKTVPLKFYLVDENRKPIKDITDEFMKVLNPEPKEVEIKKVLFTRNRQTSLMDMNVSYVLHTDYSITFTANKDAQVGDSYNTDGSKLDNLPMFLNPAETPNYTYEPGITLHEKNKPGHVAFINAFFDVIKATPNPNPNPEPPKPKPPVVPPTPVPPTPVPPTPVPPTPVPPTPVPPTPELEPTQIPILEPKPETVPVQESVPKPEQAQEPTQVTEAEPSKEITAPNSPEILAHTGSTTSTVAGTGLAFLLSAFGTLSLKRTRIGKHGK
ncbi:LptA/OstA family protein [Gardnerella vaginalis]|uniref:LptA/OstA family protein n=1 Tax=Gardnerella vaginalis TaxID=2702 RepID=UPI003970DBF2